MDRNEVQAIVYMTIQEFKRQGLLKDRYSIILKEVEPVIREYFISENNKIIESFLLDFSSDPYIDIIYYHYKRNIVIDQISAILDKDASTIKRNKKRLIMEIYNRLQEGKK